MAALDASHPSHARPFWQAHALPQVRVQHVPGTEFNTRLAQDIAQRLRTAIAARGVAVLSVSGGKSPIALFEALRVQALDWAQVRVTLVDERCVSPTHTDSNAWLVRTHLLQDAAKEAQFMDMTADSPTPSCTPAMQAQAASQVLSAAGDCDVLVLGMGADGHTASLFPDAPNLSEALDMHNTHACVSIELTQPPANAPYARITQTLPQILRARHIVLPLAGSDKHQTLALAWQAPSQRYPISFVLHQTHTPVALWLTS